MAVEQVRPPLEFAPQIGTLLDTIYGRARVMDVLRLPDEPPTVYLRPERGGCEWTVTVDQLSKVLWQ